MISSRAVGKWATGLILEGYASKGFHNKAKSCNWGPMAGFVLADPRFTKANEPGPQTRALQQASAHGALEVPLYISELRRRWLLRNGCMRSAVLTDRTHYYWATSVNLGRQLLFVLKLATTLPGAHGRWMWSVNYALSEGRGSWRNPEELEFALQNGRLNYLPVLAMRDPQCTLPADDFRAATTGDYDLFAIFAPSTLYSPDDLDRRMVSHANLERNIKRGVVDTGEDPDRGNMTQRIRSIRKLLNKEIRGVARYRGGDMVHHSDEGGRPFVDSIDLPLFAVVPKEEEPYCLETVQDLREFISTTLKGYAPVFNPGWMEELTHARSIKRELLARSIKRELGQRFNRG
jgi:hypothetical protein